VKQKKDVLTHFQNKRNYFADMGKIFSRVYDNRDYFALEKFDRKILIETRFI